MHFWNSFASTISFKSIRKMDCSLPQKFNDYNSERGDGEEKKRKLTNTSVTTAKDVIGLMATTKVDALPPERKTDDDINQKAERFIKNFKQELMIQRLESIANYEEMLARGL